ncbi:major allergen Pru ar 1-like [Dorcoceras hygrometricum]|uniref:Major allergen Pru ar 1-like n=1 Tax=Dorcoceras hygrometricum TaxID=472368 RepID=A0A2Z7B962_9LAMI|nr:major allergen Pru ar 1-like [Dorcoceras hygrometricum]
MSMKLAVPSHQPSCSRPLYTTATASSPRPFLRHSKASNIHGDGGVGTIKLITFGEGSQFKSVKHRVDEIDEANHVYKYSIIEGDVLGDDLESISYVVKFEASHDGGSVCKTISYYHTKHDAHGITEEKIKEGKEKAKAIFKAVEAHLHAHPHDY